MKKLLVLLLVLLFSSSSYAGSLAVLGGQKIDSGTTYPHITFFWTCDSETFDTDDCSDGDDTPVAESGATIDTVVYQVGSGSCDFPTTSDRYTFTTNPGNIAEGQNGRVGFWLYITDGAAGAGGLIRVLYDGSNYIWLRVEPGATDEIQFIVQVGGSREVDISTSTANMAATTWYWVEAYWNATGNECKLIVYNAAGVEQDSVTDSDAFVGWTGTTEINIGEYTAVLSDVHIDNIIFSSDPTESLLTLRNLTSVPSGACDG